jgi:cyclic pyranopterin phosphate synthase
MTPCADAARTIYHMGKGLERGVTLESVRLLEKTGGKSDWHAGED